MQPITNKQLITIYQSLVTLSNERSCIWYTITKNIAKLKHSFNTYVEVEQAIIDKLVEKDELGNIVTDSIGQFVFQTQAKKEEFDTLIKKEQSEVIEVEFYQTKITPEFINESHASALIEPLIDIILIE